jgi:hypothetical protein
MQIFDISFFVLLINTFKAIVKPSKLISNHLNRIIRRFDCASSIPIDIVITKNVIIQQIIKKYFDKLRKYGFVYEL